MNNKNSGKSQLVVFALLFTGLFLTLFSVIYNARRDSISIYSDMATKPAKTFPTKVVTSPQKTIVPVSEKITSNTINLDVPFITQAPFRAWKVYPFNHTCEEASVLMIRYYLTGKKIVDEHTTKQELLSMVDFENKTYGFSDDTTTEETARLIKDYYGYDVQVYYDISSEEIKKEIDKGSPVIVPTAGRLLGNPYFTPPGPEYHMLVIKGYDSEGFITNDPGTYNRGIDYKYSFGVLKDAIHDFNQTTKTADGRSAMIVVTLPQ